MTKTNLPNGDQIEDGQNGSLVVNKSGVFRAVEQITDLSGGKMVNMNVHLNNPEESMDVNSLIGGY